jgi:type I restriction enzyme, S subunit
VIELVPMPSHWPKALLSDICDIRGGFPAPQDEAAYENGEIPFVRMKDVGQYHLTNNLCKTEQSLNRSYFDASHLQITPRGSILIPRSGSVALNHRAILNVDAVVVSHLCALVPTSDRINLDFLYRFLCMVDMRKLTKKTTGLDSIAFSDLNLVAIPIPPLNEQQRIAEILDKADELRVKRRVALAHLDTLTQSIFLDLFGDPIMNSNGWQRVPLHELLANIDSGWSPVCLDRQILGNEWGVLKLGAVTSCEYKSSENKALPDNIKPDPELEVKVGDLLFTRKNTHDLVAACALVHETPPRLMMSDLIFRLRLRQNVGITPSFLHQLLIFPSKRKLIQKLAGGSAGSMPNISKGRLQNVLVELPPIVLQQEFARRVSAIEKLKAAHKASLNKLDALFASLQYRAFRGEL